MGANFRDLKDVLNRLVHDRFDHRHLNDTPPFDDVIPTAENVAREVYRILAHGYAPPGTGRLARVEVWEGPASCVAYEEADG